MGKSHFGWARLRRDEDVSAELRMERDSYITKAKRGEIPSHRPMYILMYTYSHHETRTHDRWESTYGHM